MAKMKRVRGASQELPGIAEADTGLLDQMGFRFISTSEYLKRERARKKKYGLHDISELEKLKYPTYVTVTVDYCATGEGRTLGIYMTFAFSAEKLELQIRDRFGYFAGGAEVMSGLKLIENWEILVPPATQRTIEMIVKNDPGQPTLFSFFTEVHKNYS